MKLAVRSKSLFSVIISLALTISSSKVMAVTDKNQFKRPDTIPFPADNPYSVQKAALGKMLFFDPRLSKNRNLTCASCHNPSFGWEDATNTAIGAQNTALDRHSPTIINAAWGDKYFWDGRAASLEEQAMGPIESQVEMNLPIAEAVKRISEVPAYRQWFKDVFGSSGVTATNLTKAIATFERTVVSGQAPFDAWIEGDESAISDKAKRGFEIFNGKANCVSCHAGWNFTDHKFHDIGLSDGDEGRIKISGNPADKFAFKTPSLRNIGQRAPYMHTGNMKTLTQVIVHYVGGGQKRPSLSDKMKPVPLTASEIDALEAFLLTLTGKDKPVTLPTLPF